MDWQGWNGKPCDADTIQALADSALSNIMTADGRDMTYVLTGDTMMVAFKHADGTVTLTDCMVRRRVDIEPMKQDAQEPVE
jgi:hypothetical protein